MGETRIPKDPKARERLYREAGLTGEEQAAIEQWCATQTLRSIDDLLSPDEQVALTADLTRMARQRRAAEDAARDIPLAARAALGDTP